MTAEATLAERIRIERNARGWSYDQLASAMTEVGCSIQPSAIFKIEKGDPPRRITVNEFVALSEVWAIPLDRLVSE
jgi:transcriptional regulator with XRE-family HTH domain